MSQYEKESKFLALILRHKPEAAGISLDKHGWADVNKLIEGMKNKYPDFAYSTLLRIVLTDDKQRYSFNEDRTKIRANQGHSIQVDVELKETVPPDILYHGTAMKSFAKIMSEGIKSMQRLHVHLSEDENKAVETGKRHGEPVILIVNAKKMYEAGFKFYLSENNVWLTDFVPKEFIGNFVFYNDKK